MPLPNILGPFVGHTTTDSTKIWLWSESKEPLWVTLQLEDMRVDAKPLVSTSTLINARIAEFSDLRSNTRYRYQIWTNAECTSPLPLDGLEPSDLYVWTMPILSREKYRFDFLLLSCNDPFSASSKHHARDGFEVWRTIPEILERTSDEEGIRVSMAILAGDQVYADRVTEDVLNERDPLSRLRMYVDVYRKFWSHIAYRKVLCSLPAVLMWDDHDITDGWGSRSDSFNDEKTFKPEWKALFETAQTAFAAMQASRNPPTKIQSGSFDFFFSVGPIGFVVPDLRTNRNFHTPMIWSEAQTKALKEWVEANRHDLDVLFFVSPVVFANGDPDTLDFVVKVWSRVLPFFKGVADTHRLVRRICMNSVVGRLPPTATANSLLLSLTFAGAVLAACLPGGWTAAFLAALLVGLLISPRWAGRFLGIVTAPWIRQRFERKVGDLNDDIDDAWNATPNAKSATKLLDYLFSIQNDSTKEHLHTAILSGDIHAGGHSVIISRDEAHQDHPQIPHIVSSSVGYPAQNWIVEALYRSKTIGTVPIGDSERFGAQISHHFTQRNVAVLSVRKTDAERLHLKAKHYVEGFSEPQTHLFDLGKGSHREHIDWHRRASLGGAVDNERRSSRKAKSRQDFETAWRSLERAHILGQSLALKHFMVHLEMLKLAWSQKQLGEVCGQLIRLIVAAPSSARRWYPVGNTGRSSVGMFKTMVIPPDLQKILDETTQDYSSR